MCAESLCTKLPIVLSPYVLSLYVLSSLWAELPMW
jgi:hypothetical protein